MVCPRCSGQATVFRVGKLLAGRFSCLNCGATIEKSQGMFRVEGAKDPYFGFPLYLQVRCSSGTVWAYNWAHWTDLRAYVSADLRTQSVVRNNTYMNRLPRWVKAAKNRKRVLVALDRMAKR